MSCPLRRSSSSAFTLVEIIVVVLILAIAAAVVIPQVVGTDSFAVISAARMLSCDLEYAQNEAITTQSNITVRFNLIAESYELRNASQRLNHPINHTEYLVDLASQRGFEEVVIVSADFDGLAEVTFDELGAPIGAGSVTLQAGSHVYRVDVAPATGKVTVTSIGS